MPATSSTICRYAAYLARSLKYNSVKQYLNIIRLFHEEWNLPSPLTNNFALTCTLKGIRRHLGDAVVRKKPITPEFLQKILSNLDVSLAFDATVWAVCLSMFYGLLRKSNVLPKLFDSSKHLRRRDVEFLPWGALLHIRWSKVIQFQSRIFDLPLPRLKSNAMCPVQAIFNCFQFTQGADLDGPAFVYKINGHFLPLTCEAFITRVRHCLALSGVNPSEIASHSFRRGGASFCYAIGLPTDSIKLLGDWRSSCYQSYIDNDANTRFQIIRRMQQAM